MKRQLVLSAGLLCLSAGLYAQVPTEKGRLGIALTTAQLIPKSCDRAARQPPRHIVICSQVSAIMDVMWSLDPEIVRQLERLREMVTLQHQTPTREWPLVVEESREELLVVREWPNGTITAYTMPVPGASK